MIKKLKENFENGVEKIKWFASLLSDRLKIELSVMEMKEHADRQVLKDSVILDTVGEVEKIDQELEQTRKKAQEISSTID